MDNPIIAELLRRGFGSMNKNDYEVLIFHILSEPDVSKEISIYNLSTYEISKKLQIPESKVKRLQYESELRYPPENEDLKAELMTLLKRVNYQKDGKTIRFVIKKKILRQYLADELAKTNRFFDTSFNSEIVVISVTDLYHIYETLYQDDAKELLIEVKNRVKNEKDLPTTWQDVLQSVAEDFLRKAVGKSCDTIVDFSIEKISEYLKLNKTK